eukprot:SAG22_NODE_2851_length_2157_cov_6.538873_3_plen_301_part_00
MCWAAPPPQTPGIRPGESLAAAGARRWSLHVCKSPPQRARHGTNSSAEQLYVLALLLVPCRRRRGPMAQPAAAAMPERLRVRFERQVPIDFGGGGAQRGTKAAAAAGSTQPQQYDLAVRRVFDVESGKLLFCLKDLQMWRGVSFNHRDPVQAALNDVAASWGLAAGTVLHELHPISWEMDWSQDPPQRTVPADAEKYVSAEVLGEVLALSAGARTNAITPQEYESAKILIAREIRRMQRVARVLAAGHKEQANVAGRQGRRTRKILRLRGQQHWRRLPMLKRLPNKRRMLRGLLRGPHKS